MFVEALNELSCCDFNRARDEDQTPRRKLIYQANSTTAACRNILGSLLCAPCNPYELHIFDHPTGRNNWPALCQPYCLRVYDACADVVINTDANLPAGIPVRIPGLNKGMGLVRIRDLFPTSSDYCGRFGSIDAGACHTGKSAENTSVR